MLLDHKRLFKDLYRSVCNKDVNKIKHLFFKYPSLFDDEESTSESTGMVEIILLQAQKCDNEEVIRVLMKFLRFGGTKNSLYQHLYIALSEGNVELSELLLRNGASILEKKQDMELYDKIFDRKNITTRKDIIKLLSNYNQIELTINDNYHESVLWNLLSFVKKTDNDVFEIIEILLDAGEVVSSMILDAVEKNCYEVVDYFISKGWDVNFKYDYTGNSNVLNYASFFGYKDIMVLLLQNNADVNAENDWGETALHFACQGFNKSESINLLIQYGAEISVEDMKGKTPFSCIDSAYVNYEISARAMVKEFARMAFENIPVSQKDMNLVLQNSVARGCFQDSSAELKLMLDKKFYAPHSYYSVLKMSKNLKKLAKLVNNEEFVNNFLEKFSFVIYKKDLMDVFNAAVQIRDEDKIIENRLLSIFGSYFPDVVVRKLINHLTVGDLIVN